MFPIFKLEVKLKSGLLFFCCLFISAKTQALYFQAESIKYYVSALSADSMEGRKPGTKGLEKASAFIAEQFKKYGLQPFDENGYYQQVYLKRGLFYSTSKLSVGDEPFSYPSDFSIYTVPKTKTSIQFADYVFAGNGVIDAEKGINDYKGLNVKGKLVIAENNGLDINSKIEFAKSQGAAGLVVLLNQSTKSKPETKRKIVSELYDPYDKNDFVSVVVHDGKRFKSVLNKSAHQTISFSFDSEPLTGKNVIGILPGNDPVLKREFILLTAHYDHLGKNSSSKTDTVFNGALDNATGTAALMNIAERLCSSKSKMKRSILFIATTAEEMGFLGSQGFMDSNWPGKSGLIADVNLDILGFTTLKNEKAYLTLLGDDYSNLSDVFEAEAERQDVGIMPNYLPSYFYRSDTIIFAQAGVPSIQPAFGINPSNAYSEFKRSGDFYRHEKDEVGISPINFEILNRQSEVVMSALVTLANADKKPVWKKELSTLGETKKWDIVGMGRMWARQWFW